MKRQFAILFLAILTVSCDAEKEKYITETENQYELIEGKKQIVSQIIKTLRVSDSLPIAILTKVSNFENDTRMQYLTGLTEKDGLQDYLLDSVYYDKSGNDYLKKSFVYYFSSKKWEQIAITKKKFTVDNKISYILAERPNKEIKYYKKKEIFYKYDNDGRKIVETEFECSYINCDSLFKTRYVYYKSSDKVESTLLYFWENNNWTEYKKNSR